MISKSCHVGADCYDGGVMRDLAILFVHLLATIAKLLRPGGARAVVAETLLVKHQLLIVSRGRERAPNLRPMDRVIAGFCTLFIHPGRLVRSAVVLKTSMLLSFHAALASANTSVCSRRNDAADPVPRDLRRNSSRPLSRPRGAIRAGAVAESPNNFASCSALRSIRT